MNYFNYYGDYFPRCYDYSYYYNTNNYLKDYGGYPATFNINKLSNENNNYRISIFTGDNLQVTLMSIPVGESIGLEIHPDVEQILCVTEGNAVVEMGINKNNFDYKNEMHENYMTIVPKNTWHNIINVGNIPLKLYSIYSPLNHEKGTIQKTKYNA